MSKCSRFFKKVIDKEKRWMYTNFGFRPKTEIEEQTWTNLIIMM